MRVSSQTGKQLRAEPGHVQVSLSLAISDETSLVYSPATEEGKTKGMAKGLLLCRRGEILAGESAGFGLPVLKTGLGTFFPSLVSARETDGTKIEMVFQLDREESLRVFGKRAPRLMRRFVELLVDVYMKVPRVQGRLLRFAKVVRSALRMESAIVLGNDRGRCRVVFEAREGALGIEVDARSIIQRGKLIMMNEAAGIPFDRLRIGERVWQGAEIPAWKHVPFDAVFEGSSAGIGFSLSVPSGDASAWHLACGREVARDLNWSGFALTSNRPRFSYEVNLHLD